MTLQALNPIDQAYQQGTNLLQTGNWQQAAPIFQHILRQMPNHAGALNGMGAVFHAQGNKPKAYEAFKAATNAHPGFLPAVENLGKLHREFGNFGESEKCFRKILKKQPKNAKILGVLGLVQLDQGDHKSAIQSFKKAIKSDPKEATHYYNMGHSYFELGDLAAGEESYRKALKVQPNYAKCYHGISFIKKYKNEHDPDIVAMKDFISQPKLSNEEKALYGFALGKAYNDVKAFNEAFKYYEIANGNKALQYSGYDVDKTLLFFDAIKRLATPATIRPLPESSDSSKPIFIVGMPRSGTTLIEQILSSHSTVHGAGEILAFTQIKKEYERIVQTPYPDFLTQENPLVAKIGTNYLNVTDSLAQKSAHIVNKMPGNFVFVGLIHKVLPNAKIIHCTRNPIDTCLSCYTNNFTDSIQYSYNQEWLAKYFNGYKSIMRHWHDVLPSGSVLDVGYEDLVSDPESNIRQLLTFCELEWEDACLQSHKTKRTVSTASAAQIRDPINTSSVERWRRYEKQLAPLLTTLDLT